MTENNVTVTCPPRGSIGRALDSGSDNPGSSRSGARIALPAGMAGGLWQGPPEGQMKPVSGVDRVQSLGHVKLGV